MSNLLLIFDIFSYSQGFYKGQLSFTIHIGVLALINLLVIYLIIIKTTTSHNNNTTQISNMSWFQKKISLKPRSRGAYLIDDEITGALPELKNYKIGVLHLFLQHTSAGLSLNENWDSDVRKDMTTALNELLPDDTDGTHYLHSSAGEGPDDMVGHVKSSLVGVSLSIPISNGRLATGTWQGIYLLEFRDYLHTRNVVATINGQTK